MSVLVYPSNLPFLYASNAGLPAAIVALSLSIAAGKDGIQSFVDDEYEALSERHRYVPLSYYSLYLPLSQNV